MKSSENKLVIIRHGESIWNKENIFTGWIDIGLSELGIEQARNAGKLLKEKGFNFDIGYTSELKRAIDTLNLILEEMGENIPIKKSWRLNERHYGLLQGKNKDTMRKIYGEDKVQEWRRGYEAKPPEDEPLLMNYGSGISAEEIINEYSEDEIERILREYGEEKFSKKIAKKIVEERKRKRIKSTLQLVEIVRKIVPRSKINPATRTFQAIRIETNKELENLESVLPQALKLLNRSGKLFIISFHSLEDRIVKNFIKNNQLELNKPITPSEQEIKSNPRSRSAKLRIILKK
jgi:bisphosphoglycerate-dependent phosphoglycerate mutase family 1